MPKVSVIIPVYGVEKYIERCVRSLFEQTLDDIEYLFIDDCTPDRSIEILNAVLKEYPNRQSQVVIHRMKHNSGQAAVRKWGLENATGEFVIHCDSDDWLDVNAYKSCYDNALLNNSDIVFFDFEVTDGIYHSLMRRRISTNKYDIISKLLSGQLMGSLCGMFVKKSLYGGVKYYPINNYSEDLVLSVQLVNTGTRFLYIGNPFYHYFQSGQSITSKGTLKKTLSAFHQSYNNTELILSYLKDMGILDKFEDEILTRKLMMFKFCNEKIKSK